MARPSLFQHRKFRTLSRRLGSRAVAAGSLELLWAVANDAGDPLIGTAQDVEDVADWHGTPGELAAALVASRFLDETPDGLAVHDHEHHCPRYVRRRRDREQARRVSGGAVTGHRAATGRPQGGQQPATGRPLAVTPNSHLPSPNNKDLKKEHVRARPAPEDEFGAFWTVYPRKVGKADALKAWRTLKPSTALQELILAAVGRQCLSQQWREQGGRFIPHPGTWLRQGRWDDELEPAVLSVLSGGDETPWDCPHEPHCGSRGRCERLQAIQAAKAGAA